MNDFNAEDIAHHEAAHAVIAHRLGFKVGIKFDGKSGRVVSYVNPPRADDAVPRGPT